ncbi:MAG: hypothetical protein AAF462_09500 [Thermodesulfobacteriota bacterium]
MNTNSLPIKINLFKAALVACLIILFHPCVGITQEVSDSNNKLDCSIPPEAMNLKPGDEGEKIAVKVGFFVIDIKEIDDLEQTYTADVWFNETWNDPRLSEKALGKSLRKCIFKENEIWTPTVIVVNQNGGQQLLSKIARVDPDGNVNVKQRYVGEITSDLDFSNFPFDDQELHFILAAVGPNSNDILFELDKDTTGQRDKFSAEGWTISLVDGSASTEQIQTWGDAPMQSLHRMDFTLVAQRDKAYYVWKVIAPLCLIVLMAWAVFWIDPKHLGPQVGLSTATVFTLIAYRFAIGFTIPKVSYFTRMDNFVLLSTILVFIALGTAIATSKISSDGENLLAKKIEKYMRVIYLIAFMAIIVFTLLL